LAALVLLFLKNLIKNSVNSFLWNTGDKHSAWGS